MKCLAASTVDQNPAPRAAVIRPSVRSPDYSHLTPLSAKPPLSRAAHPGADTPGSPERFSFVDCNPPPFRAQSCHLPQHRQSRTGFTGPDDESTPPHFSFLFVVPPSRHLWCRRLACASCRLWCGRLACACRHLWCRLPTCASHSPFSHSQAGETPAPQSRTSMTRIHPSPTPDRSRRVAAKNPEIRPIETGFQTSKP